MVEVGVRSDGGGDVRQRVEVGRDELDFRRDTYGSEQAARC